MHYAGYLALALSLTLTGCNSDEDQQSAPSTQSPVTDSEQVIKISQAAAVGRGPKVRLNASPDLALAPRSRALGNGQFEVSIQTRAPNAKAVMLAGEMNNWDAKATPMTKSSDGLWQVKLKLTSGPWLYKLVIDDAWQADANAPAFAPDNAQGENSVVLVDKASPLQIEQPDIARGAVQELEFDSAALAAKSRFKLYLPADYAQSNRSYPLLILLHGYGTGMSQWLDDGLISTFADNLLATGQIEPFIIAMPDANTSFYQPPYDQLVVNEIPAYLAAHYRLKTGPANTAIAGVSMGGFGSLQLALHYPNQFGFSASFSGAFTDLFFIDYQQRQAPKLAHSPLIYVGDLDLVDITGGFAESENKTILQGNRTLKATFETQKQGFEYQESFGGHDWHYWHSLTPELLKRVSAFFQP